MPSKCFLSQQNYAQTAHASWRYKSYVKPVGGQGTKFLYQCQEYKPGGPLSLPPAKGGKNLGWGG